MPSPDPIPLVGYTERWSFEPGDSVPCHVSCPPGTSEFSTQLVRMRAGDSRDGGPGLRWDEVADPANGKQPGRSQALYPGSFALIDAVRCPEGSSRLTMQATIWPTRVTGESQTIIYWGDPSGPACATLELDEGGCLLARTVDAAGGEHELRAEKRLERHRWYLVAAGWESGTGVVVCTPWPHDSPDSDAAMVQGPLAGPDLGEGTVVLAGALVNDDGRKATEAPFSGRMEWPAITAAGLDPERLQAIAGGSVAVGGAGADTLAAWDFSDGISTFEITDVSGNGHHGTLHNLPLRAVCGSTWTGETVDYQEEPSQYGAIHFLEDGLEDAGWRSDVTYTLPATTPSGCYAVKLSAEGARDDFLPFFVRPGSDDPRAAVAVLMPTATYLAYSNARFFWEWPFQELLANHVLEFGPEAAIVAEHPELGLSSYEVHGDGTDVSLVSMKHPNLNLRPDHWKREDYSTDLSLIAWLDRMGIHHDVITDHDLDEQGADLIAPYSAVLTGSHPEYVSVEMYDALRSYASSGGRLMYLGGNGFMWSVAIHRERPWVMEVRKLETWTRRNPYYLGEGYMAFTGARGGHPRATRRNPERLVGVGTCCFGFDEGRPYVRTAQSYEERASFVFEGVDEETIAATGGGRFGGIVGQEWDNTDMAAGTPEHAMVLARSAAPTAVTQKLGAQKEDIAAEMVFFETGAGGAVFSASSMLWCSGLPHNDCDNAISRITANVLRRFTNPDPFGS